MIHFVIQHFQVQKSSSIMQPKLESEKNPVIYMHTVSEAGRLLPSSSRWNAIALDFNLTPNSSASYESIPSQYPKSVDCNLVITDKKHFHIFIFVTVAIFFAVIAVALLVHFLPQKHKHQDSSINLKLAINQALTFYDAQKCTTYFSSMYHLHFGLKAYAVSTAYTIDVVKFNDFIL